VSLPEAKLLLKEDDELIKEVFDYWSRKKKSSRANCLLPNVKPERRDGSSTSDPYVAFRRRTEKMQTRKVGAPRARGVLFLHMPICCCFFVVISLFELHHGSFREG